MPEFFPCPGRPYFFKCFKGCLPQFVLGSFFNTLSHLTDANASERTIPASHVSHTRLDYLLDFNPFMDNVIKWPNIL